MTSQVLEFEDLLRACADGDASAFKSIYDAESSRMLALATKMLRRRDLAEEVVHDAFVQIWNHAARFDPTLGSARAWIYSILRYRALNSLRARGEMSIDDAQILDTPDPGIAVEDAVDIQRQTHRLASCLERLETPRRHPILLAFYQGLSHGQIATRLQTPLGTIKSRIRAGLRALHECLQS